MSNREILFKGKSSSNGEWVTGDFHFSKLHLYAPSIPAISYDSGDNRWTSKIDIDTRCQYIGLLVKQEEENGQVSDQKAFEHDIVFNEDWVPTAYEIVFEDGEFLLRNETAYAPIEYLKDFVRIGNSIDNPELLNP